MSDASGPPGPDGLKTLLAFTALRLELGWLQSSITASNFQHFAYQKRPHARLEDLTKRLLN